MLRIKFMASWRPIRANSYFNQWLIYDPSMLVIRRHSKYLHWRMNSYSYWVALSNKILFLTYTAAAAIVHEAYNSGLVSLKLSKLASNARANVSRKRLSLVQVSQHLDLSDSGVFEEDDTDRESNYQQLDFEPNS